MSGSGEAVGGGGALAAATGRAEGGSKVMGGGFERRKPVPATNWAGATVDAVVMPDGHIVDYSVLSGAEFQRAVGVDPEKWAAAFLQVYAQSARVRTAADRQAFVAAWFRDAMDAAEENGRTTYSAAYDYR